MSNPKKRLPADGTYNVQEIVAMCGDGFVPTNLQIGDAVAAHKVALDLYAKSADPDHDRRTIANTMRAVVLVVVRTADEAQQQIDCAKGMPLGAWDKVADGDAAEVRAVTLAMLERQKRDRSHAA